MPSISPISERDYHALPYNALWQMRIVALLTITFLVGTMGVILIPVWSTILGIFLVMSPWMILLVVSLLLCLLCWVLTAIQYRYTGYHLDDDGLAIRQGMLWRKETFVLRSRVQHIDIVRNPLSRSLGLAKLQVFTAGTKLGSIALNGVSAEDAEYIRDQLINQYDDTL